MLLLYQQSGHAITDRSQDTRSHVVAELYETEKSYVESLEILMNRYMKPLKVSDQLIESILVDEIFYQIPEILKQHETFLELLSDRLKNWDSSQNMGDIFLNAFTNQPMSEIYIAFINNWTHARELIRLTCANKPAFAKFLDSASREHKGKLTLDALMIMPVQRIPRYELLIKELIKHTDVCHPDHELLLAAQKEIHELALKINAVEEESFAQERLIMRMKEIENVIDGVDDLIHPDRAFIRHDFVTIPGGLGTKKDRCLFLFSDLLLIASIKRKSGVSRKSSAISAMCVS